MTVSVGVKKIREGALLPRKGTSGASGWDVSYGGSRVWLEPGETALFGLGFALQIPEGYECQVRSRSGLARAGIVVANSPGTIDSDYRGEVGVLLRNNGPVRYAIDDGARIAQLVFAYVPAVEFVDYVTDVTERGDGGFGSTGS